MMDKGASPKRGEAESHGKKTREGLIWAFAGTGIQNLLQMLVMLIMARLISAEEFGLVNLALVAVALTAMLSNMGVGQAIIQRQTLSSKHLTAGFVIATFTGVVFGIMMWLASEWMAAYFQMEQLSVVLKVLSVLFPLMGMTVVSEAVLQREMRFRPLSGIQVVSYFIGYGLVGISLGFLHYGIWALIAAHVIQVIIRSASLLIVVPPVFIWRAGRPNKETFSELMRFGGFASLDQAGNFIALQIDNIIIGRWLGAGALGLYGRAYQLAIIPATLLGQVLDKVLFSSMAKIQDDTVKLKQAYLRSLSATSALVAPISVFCVLCAPEIIYLLLGERWDGIVRPFQLLCLGMVFRTSYKVSNSVALAKGYVVQRALRQFLYIGFVVAGAGIGLSWGLNGAAIGVLLAIMAYYLNTLHLSKTILPCTWRELIAAHRAGAVAVSVVSAGLFPVTRVLRFIQVESVLFLFISSILACGLYSLLIYSMPALMFQTSREALRTRLIDITARMMRIANRARTRRREGGRYEQSKSGSYDDRPSSNGYKDLS